MLFLGAVIFGYDFYIYNRLEQAVRAGARFASMAEYDAYGGHNPGACSGNCSITLPASADFAKRISAYTVFGNPDAPDNAQPIIEGLTPNKIAVTVGFQDGVPVSVQVGVAGYSMNAFAGKMPINKPVTRFPYMGNYVPVAP